MTKSAFWADSTGGRIMEDHSSNERKEISKSLKRFFSVGDFGFNLMTNIETYYFQFFLTDIAKYTIPVVTLIATLTSLVDAALSWVYGVLLNTMKPMKWGRYRSWLAVIPWLVPFLYAFQFIKLNDGAAGIVVIIVATITSHIAWNIPFVANISMINIASKTPDDRMALSSTRALWGALGMVLYSYVGPGAVSILAAVVGAKNSYGAAAFVFGALMAAGYFAHFKMFEGYEETGAEEIARLQREKKAKQDQHAEKGHGMLKSLTSNPYLLGLIVADLAKYVYMFVANGIAVYYFTYVAGNAGLTATFILISNLLGVAASYLSKKAAGKFSARNTVIIAYLSMVVVLVLGFLFYNSTWVVLIMVSIAQFFCTMTNACGPALYADCAIYSEYKTGTNATGMIMGLSNIPLKIGVVSRGILINACLAMAGFSLAVVQSNEVTEKLARGISMGFTVIPAIAVGIGALILIFGYKLSSKDIEGYSAEIEKRKQNR